MLTKYTLAIADWVPFLQNNFPKPKIFTFFKIKKNLIDHHIIY